jgi:hypothetical protein
MLFRGLRKAATMVLKSVPTTARFSEESKSLAEKYESQVAWMREKGINGSLGDTDRLPPRRAAKASRKDSDK